MEEEKKPYKISLEEFKNAGYLREVNRRFFHPLGMALTVIYDEQSKSVEFGFISKYPDGVNFGIKTFDIEKIKEWATTAQKIDQEMRDVEIIPGVITKEEDKEIDLKDIGFIQKLKIIWRLLHGNNNEFKLIKKNKK